MSENAENASKQAQVAPEPPQSPGIVRKAADTVAKPKVKPSPAPTAAPQAAKPAVAKAVVETPVATVEKPFNVFSIFGWGD